MAVFICALGIREQGPWLKHINGIGSVFPMPLSTAIYLLGVTFHVSLRGQLPLYLFIIAMILDQLKYKAYIHVLLSIL